MKWAETSNRETLKCFLRKFTKCSVKKILFKINDPMKVKKMDINKAYTFNGSHFNTICSLHKYKQGLSNK